MAGPVVTVQAVPTGGAVLLRMPEYLQPPSGVTQMTLAVAVSGSGGMGSFTTFYSGVTSPVYLDTGEAYPAPLVPTVQYVYQVADSRGTTQTDPVTPACSMTTQPDQLSQVMLRLMQGFVNAVPLQGSGWIRPQLSIQFPRNGLQAMPFIVLNLDLIQQTEVQIGEDVENPDLDNDWTLFANAKRMWRTTVMSASAEERDWWRDSLLAAFRAMIPTAFQPMGYNVSHSFQAASYTDAREWEGHGPGFYGADVMTELDGVFPVAVLTGYGIIREIDSTATFPGGASTSMMVPPASGA